MGTQSTPADGVLIRRATAADADFVYAFICALEDTTIDPGRFQAIYQLNINFPPVHYFVAEQAGEVIGFISCHTQHLLHHGGKVGEIQEFFVRPDRRGKGIGRQLLAAVMALATEKKFVNLEVTTNQKRQDTIRFYERASFLLSHYKLVKPIRP
ncbi:GNAT family N-acetyltransferase [Spirosoma luteum]|uniref:GNAT family N-acetyltransferase n=1 Tax=Spirosoma luteum TaxID=431553 RepID=UPI0003828A4F|nr:GNAT family N-acetyltransferase [Spirosoma luteum]